MVPEEAALVLVEGVAKGGYPVDISAQSSAELTSLGPSDLSASALIESGLEPAAVAQLDAGFIVLDTQESYSGEQDFPSITEVIRPMEMAELVDILPTLSLIEEEAPTGPPTLSVIDVLESFGLGIDENNTLFDLGNSGLISGAGCLSQPDLHCNDSNVSETAGATMALQGQDMSAFHAVLSATGGDVPEDTETQLAPIKGTSFQARNQVEWDRPSNSSS